MTLDIPIDERMLPYLDRQEVKYEDLGSSPDVIGCTWIRIEVTTSNITAYGWARQKYGQHLGLKHQINLPQIGNNAY